MDMILDKELLEKIQDALIESGEDEELVYALSTSTLLFLAKEKGIISNYVFEDENE